jgi:hypothetical protein
MFEDGREQHHRESGCTYSSVHERVCRTDERGMPVCETRRRVFRKCPGRPKEELDIDQPNERWVQSPEHDGFGTFDDRFFGGFSRHPFEEFDRLLEEFFGGEHLGC